MTGAASAHTNRPELVATHGYDTKFAMHALRLGVQGVELLSTGRITLPVPEPDLSYLRQIRRGELPLDEVLAEVDAAESRLLALRRGSQLPEQPDRAWVDRWLHRTCRTGVRDRDAPEPFVRAARKWTSPSRASGFAG